MKTFFLLFFLLLSHQVGLADSPGIKGNACTSGRFATAIASSGLLTCQVPPGGGGAVWGDISGTLSNQTDLQTALNLKAPLASPTFSGTVTVPLTALRAVVTDSSSHLTSAVYTNSNTALAIVQRDGAGNFNASTITSNLNGNATTASSLASVPAGCTSGQFATGIAANGDLTCSTPSSGVAWGSITGTLSAQTDLQNALNLKAGNASNSDITAMTGLTGNLGWTAGHNASLSTANTSVNSGTAGNVMITAGNATGTNSNGGNVIFQAGTGTVTNGGFQFKAVDGFSKLDISGSDGTVSIVTLNASQLVGTTSAKALQSVNLTGDVTTSGFATTISSGSVTLAKMANMATGSLLGRSSGGSGVPQVITVGSGLTLSGGTLTATGGGGGVSIGSAIGGATVPQGILLQDSSHNLAQIDLALTDLTGGKVGLISPSGGFSVLDFWGGQVQLGNGWLAMTGAHLINPTGTHYVGRDGSNQYPFTQGAFDSLYLGSSPGDSAVSLATGTLKVKTGTNLNVVADNLTVNTNGIITHDGTNLIFQNLVTPGTIQIQGGASFFPKLQFTSGFGSDNYLVASGTAFSINPHSSFFISPGASTTVTGVGSALALYNPGTGTYAVQLNDVWPNTDSTFYLGALTSGNTHPFKGVYADFYGVGYVVGSHPTENVGTISISSTAQTTLVGSAGTAICTQTFQGPSQGHVMCYLAGYSTTSQSYTFPFAFAHAPNISGSASAISISSASTTALTFTAAVTLTGWVFADGY